LASRPKQAISSSDGRRRRRTNDEYSYEIAHELLLLMNYSRFTNITLLPFRIL
jgi:hypothetical protein